MASDKLLIRNGRIIDPANKLDAVGDLLIESGRVARGGGKINGGQADAIDAAGHASSISGPAAPLGQP